MSDNPSIFKDIETKVGDKSFDLLYRTRDNVNVDEFHMKCDGKGPTVTILYGKYNTIFGGYTSQSWSSDNNKLKNDDKAFLFYKRDNAQAKCVFIPIKKGYEHRAITCDATFGPTFGGGPFLWNYFDLQTFKRETTKKEYDIKDGYIHLNGTISIGTAYEIKEELNLCELLLQFMEEMEDADSVGESDINAETLAVKKIEVYQVVADQLPNPWRQQPKEEDTKEMKRCLEKMKPPTGLKHYNILLIGLINSGKSSFYNTLASVFAGEIKENAPALEAATSVTNKIHAYALFSKDGKDKKELNLRIVDIRGFDDGRGYDYELMPLLNGQLPVGYEIFGKMKTKIGFAMANAIMPWQKGSLPWQRKVTFCHDERLRLISSGISVLFPEKSAPIKEDELDVNASLKDEMHLVCFVTGTPNFDMLTDTLHKRIQFIQKRINKKGLPVVVVATKYDELCPKIRNDPLRVYKSPKAREATKTISSFFGVKEKHIFPVVNYINDHNVDEAKDTLALQALYAMVHLTHNYLESHKDMAKKPDNWSERATKFQIPKHKNEKDEELRKFSAEMSELGESHLRVLCVGAVFSGKTSFIDSVASTLRDEICSKASGGYAKGKYALESATEKMYQIKYKHESGDMKSSKVYFGDTPGFQWTGGIRLEDVQYIIQGHVPNKYKIKERINKDSKKFKKKPEKKDRIHCVCFVFDISTPPSCLPENTKTVFKQLQQWISQKDIPYVVILTKGDLLSDAVKENKLKVFENNDIKEHKDTLIDMFECKQSKIFPVINYVHEDKCVPESDALLIAVFREILKLGKEYLEEFEDEDSDENGGSKE